MAVRRSAELALLGLLACLLGPLTAQVRPAGSSAPPSSAEPPLSAAPVAPPAPASPPPRATEPPPPGALRLAPSPVTPSPWPAGSVPARAKDPPTPVVALRVRVPSSVGDGQEIEYHICADNRSTAPAHHVLVRTKLPANARFVRATPEPTYREPELGWTLGTLEPGACKEIVLVLAPTTGGEVKCCARVQFEHGSCVCTAIEKPSLRFRKIGPATGLRYDVLTYKLEVTNTSKTPVSGVTLTDALPEGLQHKDGKAQLTWDLGTLKPAECRCIEYQVVAMITGQHRNRAEVRAGDIHAQAESVVTITEPQLTLKKTGPAQCLASQAACYQITVSNPGTAPVTNLVITDPVPEKAKFEKASDGGQLAGNQVKWALGTLAPGASRTVELLLRHPGSGRICNRATASADRGLTAQGEVCTDFVGASALLLQIDPEPMIEVRGEGRYLIRVQNTGTEPARQVQIAAFLPEQLELTQVRSRMKYQQEGKVIRFEPIELPPRAEEVYEVRARANRAAEVVFRVELTSEHLPAGPVRSEQRTTLYDDPRTPTPSTQLQPPPARP